MPSDMTDDLLAELERVAPRPLSVTELARRVGLERYDQRALVRRLEAEVEARRLRRVGKTRYQWLRPVDVRHVRRPAAKPATTRERERGRALRPAPAAAKVRDLDLVEGRYTRTRSGYGFVTPAEAGTRGRAAAVFIPAGREGDALHGDVVEARIVRRTRWKGGEVRTSGEVERVVRRASRPVVGTLRPGRAARPGEGARWFLVPESDLLPVFAVEGGHEPRREDEGRIAVGRVLRGAEPFRPAAVELERVLGEANDPEVQFLSIALEHGLRIEFPPEVQAEADALPLDPAPSDFADREDLRELPFVTIDGETARDFDDAVCLEPLPGGGSRLWVAIADVSNYVRPGTALDLEAALRGTSVYFPDRAIPMLPERLSNELCSLNPGRDRLVVAACMTYDRAGVRRDARFVRGVIASRTRLTYTQVAAVLSDADTPEIRAWREELAPLMDALHRMRELMRLLFGRRMASGSLDIDLPEALIDIEAGRSVGVRLAVRNDAHRMIEEFMLEANQAVALFLEQRGVPFPYRIHEPPNPADVDALNEFLAPFGAWVNYQGTVRPQDVQQALTAIEGHPLSRVLSRQVLRALMQARYSTENVGHFGLAFPTYCHFTSPIRRYPDLLVHRQLVRVLEGRIEEARAQAEELAGLAESSSQRERDAITAERAMLDLKKAEFMLDHLLEEELGTIVGVAPFGFFVELDRYPVEGLVRADDLGPGTTFDERARALIVRRSGVRFRLGDRVMVEATDVSLARRQITFALLERVTGAAQPAEGARRASGNGSAARARGQEGRLRRAAVRGDGGGAATHAAAARKGNPGMGNPGKGKAGKGKAGKGKSGKGKPGKGAAARPVGSGKRAKAGKARSRKARGRGA